MPVVKIGESFAIVRFQLDPIEVPELLRRHQLAYPGAGQLDDRGRALIDGGFQPDRAMAFVRGVCIWGKGHRFADRVVTLNSADQIATALREAVELATGDKVGEAVDRIAQLKRLGQSFASKQLRFLIPDKAVILDSVIRGHLGYAESVAGYREFLTDCRQLMNELRGHEALDQTMRERLRVCDVEAAIFAKIQGY